MILQAFIQKVNGSISQELRDELSLTPEKTDSQTLKCVSDHCKELYEELGQNLTEWLLETFEHKQLASHNLHLNAMRIAGSYDRHKAQHFLYTIPVRIRFDKAIKLYQYGDANVTVSKGDVRIYGNRASVRIETGATVSLNDCAQVEVDGKAIVEACGSTFLTAQGGPMIKARDNSYIIVKGDATIDATDDSNIEIVDGSPIILANKHVRIANRIKKEAGQTVRLMIGETVLIANYFNNGSIIRLMGREEVSHVWEIDDYDPTMGRFIENMRQRHARNRLRDGYSLGLTIDPDLGLSKEAMLGLLPHMPPTAPKRQIREELSGAASHEELLDRILSRMDLFMESGLTHELLDQHFTYIHLTKKGIYTNPEFLHHLKPLTKEVFLLGCEQFSITEKGLLVHAYEHAAVLGENISIDLHDHSLALSLGLEQAQLSGHSLAGVQTVRTLTLSHDSLAQIGDLDMASLSGSSCLIGYNHIDILSLHDKAEAYHHVPPTRVNKESETSRLHYVLSKDNPFVKGTTAGITVHEREADLIAVLKTYQSQKTERENKKRRGK